MDRFNSNEDVDLSLNPDGLDRGSKARRAGLPLSANPYDEEAEREMHFSWANGWVDMDTYLNEAKEPILP